MSFRSIVKKEAGRRGWSGYRLGKESGVPIRTIQKFLAGDADMTAGRLERICLVLGLELRPMRKEPS
jgi:transcriptional regulator with XRE-family HTH domain